MKKSKNLWFTIIFLAVLAAFYVFSTYITLHNLETGALSAQEIYEDDPRFFLWHEENVKVPVSELFGDLIFSGYIAVFIVFFVSFFATAENKNGFAKNIAGLVTNRGILAVSNLFCVIFYVFILTAVVFAVTCISSLILLGYVSFEGLYKLTDTILVNFLINTAFAGVVFFFAISTKSTGVSIFVGLFLAFGFTKAISFLINHLLQHLFDISESFDIERYFLPTYLYTNEVSATSAAVGIFHLIIFTFSGIFIMAKRDVK